MEPASCMVWAVVVEGTDTSGLFLDAPLVHVCAVYPGSGGAAAAARALAVPAAAGSVAQEAHAVLVACLYDAGRAPADGERGRTLHVDGVLGGGAFSADTFAPYRLFLDPDTGAPGAEARRPFPFLFSGGE